MERRSSIRKSILGWGFVSVGFPQTVHLVSFRCDCHLVVESLYKHFKCFHFYVLLKCKLIDKYYQIYKKKIFFAFCFEISSNLSQIVSFNIQLFAHHMSLHTLKQKYCSVDVVTGRVASWPPQLHHHDEIHQQARESQTNDEPATGQEPQHPVRGVPCF